MRWRERAAKKSLYSAELHTCCSVMEGSISVPDNREGWERPVRILLQHILTITVAGEGIDLM